LITEITGNTHSAASTSLCNLLPRQSLEIR